MKIISELNITRAIKFLSQKLYDNQYEIIKSKNGFVINLKSVNDIETEEINKYLQLLK